MKHRHSILGGVSMSAWIHSDTLWTRVRHANLSVWFSFSIFLISDTLGQGLDTAVELKPRKKPLPPAPKLYCCPFVDKKFLIQKKTLGKSPAHPRVSCCWTESLLPLPTFTAATTTSFAIDDDAHLLPRRRRRSRRKWREVKNRKKIERSRRSVETLRRK